MFPPNPALLMRLGAQFGTMLLEAQMIVGMRTLGMMGLWRVPPSENARMVSEKLTAVQQSGMAATRATLAGKSPVAIASEALKPVRRRTRANVTRLARKGPGKP
ncbi:hypothetical protein SAMN05421774_10514 [Gemmobacter megaterium]|uniref:Antifreeze protein n=1 Tax=Gemmobacter megaterium TaxID=1086013 RepID=A0A1N7P708_9RHOB|nr:hypothetical protein [Gemmobacter megaterium]GGE20107.1 antifreeze protein, type I [Gemmobacter megaterium]SIT06361.1 hypothetical protein SAMN05421774_10514 [Gemmobacter megaterium]